MENHICNICNKQFVYKKGLERHKLICENKKFSCNQCGKIFSYASGLSRHMKSCKSKKLQCSICNMIYTHRSSLSRHAKVCSITNSVTDTVKNELEKVIDERFNTQNELLIKKIDDKTMSNIIISNNNINIFLDSQCKNALNMTDFVMNVPVTIEDLLYTKDNGYVNGIGNILEKHLCSLKPTERPIHCSDKKRLKFYIKNDDEWKKDEKNYLDGNIDTLTERQISHIKLWEDKHPLWYKNQNKTAEYLGILQPLCDKNQHDIKKIKKLISDYVSI